jgi:hypothetical protein
MGLSSRGLQTVRGGGLLVCRFGYMSVSGALDQTVRNHRKEQVLDYLPLFLTVLNTKLSHYIHSFSNLRQNIYSL